MISEKFKETKAETSESPVIAELVARLSKLENELANLSQRLDTLSNQTGTRQLPRAPQPKPTDDGIKAELGSLAELLELRSESGRLFLKPRQFLGKPNFKSIMETVRKHGRH